MERGANGVGVVIGESLERPIRGLLPGYSETVHPIEASTNVVVMPAGFITGAIPLDQLPDGRGDPSGGKASSLSRGWPVCWGLWQGEGGGVGPEERVRVMAEHRHAGGVLALVVDGDAGQVRVMIVDGPPGEGKQALVQWALHPGEDADAATRDGRMDEETVRVVADQLERLGEPFGRNAVDIDQDKAGIAGDVRRGTSALEGDGGDDGRLALLDTDFPLLQFPDLRLVAHPLGLMERQVGLPVKKGLTGMHPVGQLLKDRRPGSRRGSRRAQ